MNVMNTTAVVVEGRVQPDGRLEVSQKVKLPPGPVQVTVRPVAEPVQPDRFWKMGERKAGQGSGKREERKAGQVRRRKAGQERKAGQVRYWQYGPAESWTD